MKPNHYAFADKTEQMTQAEVFAKYGGKIGTFKGEKVRKPTLYIFSGLPASGKSTLAQELARKIKATFIRIDTVEQGLRDICKYNVQGGEGYELSYLVAKDNLRVGNNVIADSVNPWELTRRGWNDTAKSVGANFVNIEVICSDQTEHKKRVETRNVGIENLKMPTWEEVLNRDYHGWSEHRILVDTAQKKIGESLDDLVRNLSLGDDLL
jgi:predicted kinase